MIKQLKELISQQQILQNKMDRLLNIIEPSELSFEELEEYFNFLYPTFKTYAIYPPNELNKILEMSNLTWFDSFYLERHQNMDYESLLQHVDDWDEKYEYTIKKCEGLKRWAKTDDLNEAKKKFTQVVMTVALESQDCGFEYDW